MIKNIVEKHAFRPALDPKSLANAWRFQFPTLHQSFYHRFFNLFQIFPDFIRVILVDKRFHTLLELFNLR